MSNYGRRSLLAIWFALALIACNQPDASNLQQAISADTAIASNSANAAIEQAYKAKKSDIQVEGHGVVVKLLKDDSKGSMHQKFLVKINERQTLLFAHNIDLAPRVPVEPGDEVSFYGEYVYNPKGGIIHWTHHAPRGDHAAGWIMHKGKKYQ